MESKRLYTGLLLAVLALQEGFHPTQAKASATLQQRRGRHVKNMVFYMHDLPAVSEPTAVPVAAQNGELDVVKLGTTMVFDDKLTKGPDPNSTEIGRGQGLYTIASLTSIDLFISFTAVLHKPAMYNGSTISVQGSDRTLLQEREISVVGGTGVFRFARGYAIITTVWLDGINAIVKFNLTFVLPEDISMLL